MLAAGGGSVLQEIDVDSAQFSQILEDAVGDTFALGVATGTMPPAATAPLLALPCSTAGGEFAMEVDASTNLSAATYLRQGTGETAIVAASGPLSVYDAGAGTAVTTDLTEVPALNFGCLQNLASGSVGLGVAPGEIFALTGTNIGPPQAVAGVAESGRFPTVLGGVQVMIGGNPAPLLLVQSDLIEGVTPFELSSQYPTVQVQYMGQNAPFLEEPSAPNPAMFVINGQAAVLNQDGTVNTPANPAKLGTIISIYATGLGPLVIPVPDGEITPPPPAAYDLLLDPPNVWVGGVQSNVVWAGSAPDLIAGGAQINVQLPASLPAGTNLAAVPVFLIQPPIFSPAAPISVTE
jgi:uncharacterized protein (TIGR03437 family)